MEIKEKIKEAQTLLKMDNVDGWLLYDFRKSNDLAHHFLEIPENTMCSRRFFYWIPKTGESIKIVHRIESHVLDHLPGQKKLYSDIAEFKSHIKDSLQKAKKIAMEYSFQNEIPTLSKVDAGTIDLIRSFGSEVVTSANYLQHSESVLTLDQLRSHLKACRVLDDAVNESFKLIGNTIKQGSLITEKDVQRYLLAIFEKQDCVTEDPPICAVNAHSADPHHVASDTPIRKGDFILIDLWCKKKEPKSVYGDITRVAIAASQPKEKQQQIFNVVRQSADAAMNLLSYKLENREPVMGCDLDRACRNVIIKAGFGPYFSHRTGHSIAEKLHANGANIDSFETNDTRSLLPSTCFSIEPGIYLPDEFGIRLEHDVYINPDGKTYRVSQGLQTEILCLL